MRRRELLVASTALSVIALTSSRAQDSVVGDVSLPLTRERLLVLLSDVGRLLLAVATLRLNLMLARPASDLSNVDLGAQNAQYQQRVAQFQAGLERLRPDLAKQPDVLPRLSDQLEEAVRRAAQRLVEAGIAAGSGLLKEMIDSFWSFLFVLESTSANGVDELTAWLCGSFPFSILC